MRLLGFTEFYWVVLGFIGFLLGLNGFKWVLQGFTEYYWALPSWTGFNWVFAGRRRVEMRLDGQGPRLSPGKVFDLFGESERHTLAGARRVALVDLCRVGIFIPVLPSFTDFS